jgi:carbonic anhydrase
MKQHFPPIISVTKIGFLIFILSLFLLSGCGSTSADTAKKSKKSKAAVEEKSADSEEEATEEKPEADEDTSDDKKEADKDEAKKDDSVSSKSKENAKKSEAKKDAKKSDDKKTGEKEKTPSADEIWADLMKGNKRFIEGKHTTPNFISMRKTLAGGQHPQVIVLGCADSRVPPELLFDKNLGELFVVRDAGNIGDEVSLGSIEYAIEHLKVKVLIVLGHESCGAVAAAMSGEKMPTKNLQAIVDRISPAFEDSKECPVGGKINLECVKLNIKHSADDIMMNSPIIKKAAKEDLVIIKAVYHLETGEISRVD